MNHFNYLGCKVTIENSQTRPQAVGAEGIIVQTWLSSVRFKEQITVLLSNGQKFVTTINSVRDFLENKINLDPKALQDYLETREGKYAHLVVETKDDKGVKTVVLSKTKNFEGIKTGRFGVLRVRESSGVPYEICNIYGFVDADIPEEVEKALPQLTTTIVDEKHELQYELALVNNELARLTDELVRVQIEFIMDTVSEETKRKKARYVELEKRKQEIEKRLKENY